MSATALVTKLPCAEPPIDCQSKHGCSVMADYGVLVKEGASVLYKRLCKQHADQVEAEAKAGTLKLQQTAADRLRVHAAPPPPPAPLMPRAERPRITFPIPANPLLVPCKSCGAKMVWINHPRTRSLMPINADGDRRGESHFATCPNASQHRKPR